MNALEDDGLMTTHTIQTLNRMESNMPDQVKVCGQQQLVTILLYLHTEGVP